MERGAPLARARAGTRGRGGLNAARFARLKEILLEAGKLPAAERAGYLDRACGTDLDLLREARALLENDPKSIALLDVGGAAKALDVSPPPVATRDSLAALARASHPEQIGAYRIIEPLGEGGMGVVFRAEQREPIRREVAVKLLRRGADSAHVLARFEAERQTLARMQHPSIAMVLDAGSDAHSTPFIVMELVRGAPITTYADRESLGVEERIRLFLPVCRAVQHAHQKGAIHRDLKPSNILVSQSEGAPLPKVIDFGVAKATGEERAGEARTIDGQLLGTPEYMSPEQALGQSDSVDTRTDVYALGVILYELLAGRLPYETSERAARDVSLVEMLRIIREVPPRPLRDAWRGKGLPPADLELILSKTLEKDPNVRYAGAGELADDLERFLGSMPILARPPSTLYQIRKLVARHRIPVAFAAAFLVALAGFGVTMGALYRKSVHAERDRAIEAQTSQRVTDFMLDLFKVSAPSQSLGKSITAREILDRASERVAQGLDEEPAVQATLVHTLGLVYMSLGLYDPAAELTEKAVENRRALLGERHLDVAESETLLGWIYYASGRYDEAESVLKLAIDSRAQLLGAEHVEVAEPLEHLASLYYSRGRFDDCQRLQRQALTIKENALGPDHVEIATTLGTMGAMATDAGRYDEAQECIERSLRIYEREYGRDHFHYAATITQLGYHHWNQGQVVAAESCFAAALPSFVRMMGPDHPDVASCHKDLGGIQAALGRYDDARTHLEEACRIYEARLETHHADLAPTLSWLGLVWMQGFGDAARAESLILRAIANTEKASGPDAATLSSRLVNLGWVLETQGRFDEAEASLDRALALAIQGYGAEHYKVGRALNYLGYLAYERGQLARADSLYAASLAIFDGVSDRFTKAHVVRERAFVRYARGDAAAAESLLTSVRATVEKEGWTALPIYAATKEDLAVIMTARARGAGSEKYAEPPRGAPLVQPASAGIAGAGASPGIARAGTGAGPSSGAHPPRPPQAFRRIIIP